MSPSGKTGIVGAIAFAAAVAGCGGTRLEGPRTWSFEADAVGATPADFEVPATPAGAVAGKWVVEVDPGAPSPRQVLTQVATEFRESHFNLAVARTADTGDFSLSVHVKALARVADPEDRGGGPLFRYRDPANYYLCRWNPLEENFRVYRVVAGKREQLGSARVAGTTDEWHTIGVEARGAQITCSFDGQPLLGMKDESFAAGRVGLWTKADAVASFDDFKVAPR
ncbi:MAG: hypothetical protein L0216_02970 [Planctomycetales bacterium]|nr:hypothetical protein [Planctomycetales bacterium]